MGLPNHAMAEITYRNLELAGPPSFGEEAKEFAREIQQTLGLDADGGPVHAGDLRADAAPGREARLRQIAAPVADELHLGRLRRVHVARADRRASTSARAMLRPPRADYRYPDWPRNALGGFPAAIDPLWYTAGRAIGATLVELMTSPAERRAGAAPSSSSARAAASAVRSGCRRSCRRASARPSITAGRST